MSRRIIADAKKEKKFIDWSCAKKVKSLVLLNDGQVVGSFLSVNAIFNRLRKVTEYDIRNDPALTKESKEMDEDDGEDDEQSYDE